VDQYLFPILLFAHVFGAIASFGPSFIFPFLARQSRAMPQGGHFAAVFGEMIERRLIIPGAIIQGITGLGLVIILAGRGVDFSSAPFRWLAVGIVLYLIAIGYAIFVQAKAAERMVEITKGMSGPPPAGAPAGPPPELLATAAKLQRGGMILTVLLASIVFLMVVKPTLG
jgi:Predicted integral membrane protein (DUF2269)